MLAEVRKTVLRERPWCDGPFLRPRRLDSSRAHLCEAAAEATTSEGHSVVARAGSPRDCCGAGRREGDRGGSYGRAIRELSLGPATMSAMITAWALTYVLTRLLLPTHSKDFCNRCVSLIHVVVSIYFCKHSVRDWSRPLDGVGAASTYPQMLALTVSLAYFIYDTICCAVELPFSWEMLIHHALTIMGLTFGYLRQFSGTELVACLMLMEVSNPFMHGRELLKELKLKDSPLSFANDVAFALVFTVARIFIGPVVVYKCVVSPTSPFPVKVGAVGIQVVSILWFYKIARMVVYKLSKPKTRKVA